jgi:DNA mismatch repair protein MutS2
MTPPDLLHPEPKRRLDARALSQALVFAFASGGDRDALDQLQDRALLEPSDFSPDCFARDLFVSDFVNRCTSFRIGARTFRPHEPRLTRLLSLPPANAEIVRFRQAVLSELLEKPVLRERFEQSYVHLRELFTLLESSDSGKHFDPVARRLEILRASKRSIDALSEGFGDAESGLARLGDFARTVRESAAYENLVQLLDHEGHLATVQVKLTLGYEGQLRGFEIVQASENANNRYYVSPWRRLFTRLRLLFRGYHVRQAEVLGRLVNGVFDGVEPFVRDAFELLSAFEFYLGALGFAELARNAGLETCLPELVERGDGASGFELTALYNPFLLLEEHAPRPCDVSAGCPGFVIVTGPNSGGKTRLLQAVGLAQLLAQSGFLVPAASAKLELRQGLFVSIVDEVASDQREGRLGTELLRIRRLFEKLCVGGLVVLDELCSGTNPSEAEEIFRVVLELLAELEPQAFISTHFLHFAERLRDERPVPGLEFLQVELDAEQHPTYRFVPGVATTSLARLTAERLGVTRESLRALVEAARRDRERTSTPPSRSAPRAAQAG